MHVACLTVFSSFQLTSALGSYPSPSEISDFLPSTNNDDMYKKRFLKRIIIKSEYKTYLFKYVLVVGMQQCLFARIKPVVRIHAAFFLRLLLHTLYFSLCYSYSAWDGRRPLCTSSSEVCMYESTM